MKGISEFVLVLLILIIAVISISILWLSFYGYFRHITFSEGTSALGEVLSSCMKIDSAKNDKIYLKNCGSGLVKDDKLNVFIDEESFEFTMTPESIGKSEIAEITIYDLWKLDSGNHKIKIASPSGKVERYVKAVLPDSCVLALDFDEGEGAIAYDSSGYGNDGTLNNFDIYNCSSVSQYSTITVSCPSGQVINSIEDSVYVDQNSPASCSDPYPAGFCNRYCDYADNCIGQNSCSFTVDDAICGGDPCPGVTKKLILNVSCDYWIDGKFGKALEFDGSDDYIQTPSNELQTTNNFTIELWFKADNTSFAGHLIWEGEVTGNGWGGWDPNYEQEIHISIGELWYGSQTRDDKFCFFLGDRSEGSDSGALQISTDFTDTTNWHHVLVTVYDLDSSPVAELFLDGVSIGTNTGTTTITNRANWDTNLRIGKPGTDERYFNGTIDNVRIYNKALTPDETVVLTLGELT